MSQEKPLDRGARPAPRRYAFIDALRGYALLGVMAVHVGQSVPALSGAMQKLAASGAFGVQLFFVASALTLMISWRARGEGARSFLVRRAFRITPMFWLAIGFHLWLYGFGPRYAAPNGITGIDVAATAALLHGFHPLSINSVVPGGWSIAVEMTFYLMFPALAAWLVSLRRVAVAFAVSVALARLLDPIAQRAAANLMPNQPEYLASDFAYLWIVNQLPVFLVGFAAYHIMREAPPRRTAARRGLMLSLTVLAAAPFLSTPAPPHLVHALAFGLLAVCLSAGAGGALVNPAIVWFGRISYSGYLWHFAALKALTSAPRWTGPLLRALGLDDPSRTGLLFAATGFAVVGVSSALATATYFAVERPMIRLGDRVARRLDGASRTA